MRRCWGRAVALLAAACASIGAAGAAAARTDAPATDPRADAMLRTSQAAIGRSIGDWALVDHEGRRFELGDLRDRPLLVNFVYTGCFQVCPTTTRFLKEAAAEARRALGTDSFRIVSIGFNQPHDSPEALAQFARQQGIDDPHWRFAAPRAADVAGLLDRFGLTVQPGAGGFDHVVQVSIVDRDGRIVRQVYGDRFELPMLIDPLKRVLANAGQEAVLADLWTRVRLYCTVYDPYSGKYKLDYSLFVEIFAGLSTLGLVGWYLVGQMRGGAR